MNPNRRTLLKVGGVIGLGGCSVAYWQHRPIRRRDDINAIKTAIDIPVPTIADPVIITADHLDASYSWAREHVESTEDKLRDLEVDDSRDLEKANEYLVDQSPDNIDDDERHDALDDYPRAVAFSAIARSQHVGTANGSLSDELQSSHEVLGNRLEAFDLTYSHKSLTRTVVQAGHIESLIGTAESGYSRATDFIANNQHDNSTAWEIVETGQYVLHDAEQFLEVLEADNTINWRADFEDLYSQLSERIESAVDGAEWEYEPDVRSQAYYRWDNIQLRTFMTPDDIRDDGRLARALLTQTVLATVAETLVEFDDIPGWQELNNVDVELVDDAEVLVTEKQVVREHITSAVDAVGSDPLGAYLLLLTIRRVDWIDSVLDQLRDDVRSYERTEWQYELDRLALLYRGAVAEADAIPDIVALFTHKT